MASLDKVTLALRNLINDDDKSVTSNCEDSPSSAERNAVYNDYFCVEDAFVTSDISVSVKSIGKLSFPLIEDNVKKMIEVSSKAKFGRGEDTVLDTNVRDTQMIPANMLEVEINDHSLENVLERLGAGLNISKESNLVPHLYNMLIYGPGQFFKMHRDSEKMPNMVATLVILLPSSFKGGDLLIQHKQKTHIFLGSKNPNLVKCVVFYSDCEHEIKKVTEGYRVALTYNIVLHSPEILSSSEVNAQLDSAVDSYFQEDEELLVYHLNHNYSEHSLKWDLLKGNDITCAHALLAVANKQGRVPFLALADNMVTYDCECSYSDNDGSLIESQTELIFWVNKLNVMSKKQLCVDENVICFTQKTEDLFEPYKTEESGPTGNEGETRDHWYRRACVVLWRNKWVFAESYKEALSDLHQLTTQVGKEKFLVDEITKIDDFVQTEFWEDDIIADMLLDIALYIEDSNIFIKIVSELPKQVLSVNHIDMLIILQKKYDVLIWKNILKSWKIKISKYGQFPVNQLLQIVTTYMTHSDSLNESIITKFLIREAVKKFIESNKEPKIESSYYYNVAMNMNEQNDYRKTNKDTVDSLCKLIKVCLALKLNSLGNTITDYVLTTPVMYPPVSVAEIVLKLSDTLPTDQLLHLQTFRNSALVMIVKKLSEISGGPDDWHLPITIRCTCEYCVKVQQFFHSKIAKEVIIPASKPNRRHIYSFLNPLTAYPITFETRRVGSPYKIVIKKNPNLFTERKNLSQELTKLKESLEKLKLIDNNSDDPSSKRAIEAVVEDEAPIKRSRNC